VNEFCSNANALYIKGCSPTLVHTSVISGQRPPIDQVPADVPDGLKSCMEHCWSQQPEDRPTTDGNILVLSTLREIVRIHAFCHQCNAWHWTAIESLECMPVCTIPTVVVRGLPQIWNVDHRCDNEDQVWWPIHRKY